MILLGHSWKRLKVSIAGSSNVAGDSCCEMLANRWKISRDDSMYSPYLSYLNIIQNSSSLRIIGTNCLDDEVKQFLSERGVGTCNPGRR
jgi:hypothetical protein